MAQGIDPLWMGIGATAFALVVFANGYRLFEQGGEQRKMGLFHMVVAPASWRWSGPSSG